MTQDFARNRACRPSAVAMVAPQVPAVGVRRRRGLARALQPARRGAPSAHAKRRWIVIAAHVVFAAVLLFGLASTLRAQDFTLRPVVRQSAQATLAELIAPVPGPASDEARETVSKLLLTPLPDLGQAPGSFTFAWLRERVAFPAGSAIVGSDVSVLPAAGLTDAERAFLVPLLAFLRSQREDTQGSFFLTGLDLPRELPEEPVFRVAGGNKRLGLFDGPVRVQFRDGRSGSSSWSALNLEVRGVLPVPVAVRDLHPGEILAGSDWRLEQRPIATLAARPGEAEDWDGAMEVLRYVRAGGVLGEGFCRPSVPVKRLETVRVLMTRGDLAVELSGQAQEDGRLGQRVRVRTSTGKLFEGEVSRAREVTVKLP